MLNTNINWTFYWILPHCGILATLDMYTLSLIFHIYCCINLRSLMIPLRRHQHNSEEFFFFRILLDISIDIWHRAVVMWKRRGGQNPGKLISDEFMFIFWMRCRSRRRVATIQWARKFTKSPQKSWNQILCKSNLRKNIFFGKYFP